MADQITEFVQLKDEDNNIVQYDVSYVVDDGGDHTNTFCVVVLASEMTDATDVAEAKTKANTKAAAIKTAWVAELPPLTSVTHDDQIGDVTLS